MSNIIKLEERVKVYATSAHKYAKEGEELSMHVELAKKAELAGWVSKTPNSKPSKTKSE